MAKNIRKFDVFLSHDSKDKAVVEKIARRLKSDFGFKVWLDKWNIISGEPVQEQIEDGLDRSRVVAVFMGKTGFGKWENEEMRVAINARVSDPSHRVIPILLPNTPKGDPKLPSLLKRNAWVDFRNGLDDPDSWNRLVTGIRGIPPGDTEIIPPRFSEDELFGRFLNFSFFDWVQRTAADPETIEIYQVLETTDGRPLVNVFDEFLRSNKQLLFVLGLPGSGKSTFVRKQIREIADSGKFALETKRLSELVDEPLNIFLPLYYPLKDHEKRRANQLKDRGTYPGLRELLAEYVYTQAFGEAILPAEADVFGFKGATWIICFDGLDELPNQESRKSFLDSLIPFTERLPHVKFILTSRLGIGKVPWDKWRTATIQIKPLTKNQIFDQINYFLDLEKDREVIRQLLLSDDNLMRICSIPRHLRGFIKPLKDAGATSLPQPITMSLRKGNLIAAAYRRAWSLEHPRGTIKDDQYEEYIVKTGEFAIKTDGQMKVFHKNQILKIMESQDIADMKSQDITEWIINMGIVEPIPGSGNMKFFTDLTQHYFAAQFLSTFFEQGKTQTIIEHIGGATDDFLEAVHKVVSDLTTKDVSILLRRTQ